MKLLLAGALLPALLLMRWIYNKDAIEKEPGKLLIKLALGGALACIPAAILEGIFEGFLDNAMDADTLGYTFVLTFLIVALSEEGCKFFFLRKFSWDDPNFNFTFDGIVYGMFTGLGFAALENVMYVLEYGVGVIISRGLLSIPAHGIFGIFMGLYYARSKYADLYNNGVGHRRNMWAALLVPSVLHGFFDFCLMSGSDLLAAAFFLFVIVLDVVSVKLVQKQARRDMPMPGTEDPYISSELWAADNREEAHE